MTDQFDFGAGPVPAQRHTNPDGRLGGWVANASETSHDCANPGRDPAAQAVPSTWCRVVALHMLAAEAGTVYRRTMAREEYP